MEPQPRLRYHLKNESPVELTDLTSSMLAIGDEYKNFLQATPGFGSPSELKLYVQEIKTGSILAELVAMMPAALLFVEHANSVIEFSKYLVSGYDYLLGRTKDRPEIITRKSLGNLSKIVEPVAKDKSSQLNIGSLNVGGNVIYNFNIGSQDANVAQNIARKEAEMFELPLARPQKKAVLYWYQARNEVGNTAGDKGIIESIVSRPVKIEFADSTIKAEMLEQEHPFQRAYVVDVQVETLGGVPVLYIITNYHGTFRDLYGGGEQQLLDL